MLDEIEKISYKYYELKEGIFVLESSESYAKCFTPDNIEQAKQEYKILFDQCCENARTNRRSNERSAKICACCGDAYVRHIHHTSKYILSCLMYVNGSYIVSKKVCLRLIIIDQQNHKTPKKFSLKSVIGRYAKKSRKI